MGEHDAGGEPVGNTGGTAEHVTDGMARAFLHAALRTDERQPRPNHAVEPRIEVGGISFRPPQATGQEPQGVQRGGVGKGLTI